MEQMNANQYTGQNENNYAVSHAQAEGDDYLAEGNPLKKPQFNLKANKRFVGSGWMGESKFGKYISFKLRETLEAGTKVYLSPRKGSEGILG